MLTAKCYGNGAPVTKKVTIIRVPWSTPIVSQVGFCCLVHRQCSLTMLHAAYASTMVRHFKKILVGLLDSWAINIFNGDNKSWRNSSLSKGFGEAVS